MHLLLSGAMAMEDLFEPDVSILDDADEFQSGAVLGILREYICIFH